MADRKGFPLRMSPEVYAALQRWAADELRSLNAQIEFVLRRALLGEGRLGSPATSGVDPPVEANDGSTGTKES